MKKLLYTLIALTLFATGYRLYYPVKIIGIHPLSRNTIVLVVQNFPWTKKGKINWWRKKGPEIFNKLNLKPDDYSVFIYNTRYKKDSGTDEDSDLLCFKEMKTEQNCISKENRPLIVWRYRDGHIEYETESILRRFY